LLSDAASTIHRLALSGMRSVKPNAPFALVRGHVASQFRVASRNPSLRRVLAGSSIRCGPRSGARLAYAFDSKNSFQELAVNQIFKQRLGHDLVAVLVEMNIVLEVGWPCGVRAPHSVHQVEGFNTLGRCQFVHDLLDNPLGVLTGEGKIDEQKL